MKIAIFGGSFDPVHIGHINLALEMAEAHNLDEVWFCPASLNPHKIHQTTTSPKDRLNMLHLATADIQHFKVIDVELQRPVPSYTIDTLYQLKRQQQNTQSTNIFYLIIGADAAPRFHKWHQAEEIIKNATIIVGRRHDDLPLNLLDTPPQIRKALKMGLTPTRIIDISSTEIRNRISQNLYCGHLLHTKVLDYILSHHLYYESNTKGDLIK